jgi:hypothetical protein
MLNSKFKPYMTNSLKLDDITMLIFKKDNYLFVVSIKNQKCDLDFYIETTNGICDFGKQGYSGISATLLNNILEKLIIESASVEYLK